MGLPSIQAKKKLSQVHLNYTHVSKLRAETPELTNFKATLSYVHGTQKPQIGATTDPHFFDRPLRQQTFYYT